MMLSALAPAARFSMMMTMRSIVTSVTISGAPTFTYTPPGSSIQDPLYAQHENAEDVPLGSLPDAKVMRPSKKAQLLRMTTRRISTPLEPQGSGGMLPPGCSVSDPHYSIKDPIHYVDASK